MNILKRICALALTLVLCLSLLLSVASPVAFANTDSITDTETGFPMSSGTSTDGGDGSEDSGTEPEPPLRVQAAYSFDDAPNLIAEVGGVYPLSTRLFGESTVTCVEGQKGSGMQGYISLNDDVFQTLDQLTVAFWAKYSLLEALSANTVFELNGKAGEKVTLSITSPDNAVVATLTVFDGVNTAVCTYDLSSVLSELSRWHHFAFTYNKTGTISLVTLYVDGKPTGSSLSSVYVDLSKTQSAMTSLYQVVADELYVTNRSLNSAKINLLMNTSAAEFYEKEKESLNGGSGSGSGGEGPVTGPLTYTWAGYLFDGSYSLNVDAHGGAVNALSNINCLRIDTSAFSGKYKYGAIRKDGTAPSEYLKLDARLFSDQPNFSFACWVYRNGEDKANKECLLDLSGLGVLRFAPYITDEDGDYAAYLEYTAPDGSVQQAKIKNGAPANPIKRWVHYAMTVASDGTVKIYVNASLATTVATGVRPIDLKINSALVVTGSSTENATRTVVDEIYVSSRVLSDSDVRRIRYSGVAEYTTTGGIDPEDTTTTDPSQGSETTDNPMAPDQTDVNEDSYNATGSVAGGFIGTTFDDRSNPGYDMNHGANAVIHNGILTGGIHSYGLDMNGNAFLRYPKEILDGADALTIALSYSWDGDSMGLARSQRLFDFSRKVSSVSDPLAFIYLEMGINGSGLRLGLSDGISTTYLTCDYSETSVWTRVTVTISDGAIVIYLDDKVAATGYTEVDLAAISPNYCYVGKSGVKGDPLFRGIVDEIYISTRALQPTKVGAFVKGIANATNASVNDNPDFWGTITYLAVGVAAVLVVILIIVFVLVIMRKDKTLPQEEAPIPKPIPPRGLREDLEGLSSGPRTARRAQAEPIVADGSEDSTMKFRKVDEDQLNAMLSDDSDQND